MKVMMSTDGPCCPPLDEMFCKEQGERRLSCNRRQLPHHMLPPRSALQTFFATTRLRMICTNLPLDNLYQGWKFDNLYQGWGAPASGLYLRSPSSSKRWIAGHKLPRTMSVIAWRKVIVWRQDFKGDKEWDFWGTLLTRSSPAWLYCLLRSSTNSTSLAGNLVFRFC